MQPVTLFRTRTRIFVCAHALTITHEAHTYMYEYIRFFSLALSPFPFPPCLSCRPLSRCSYRTIVSVFCQRIDSLARAFCDNVRRSLRGNPRRTDSCSLFVVRTFHRNDAMDGYDG